MEKCLYSNTPICKVEINSSHDLALAHIKNIMPGLNLFKLIKGATKGLSVGEKFCWSDKIMYLFNFCNFNNKKL